MANPMPSQEVLDIVRRGTVIPAHPLALTRDGAFDERHQRALTRYYCAAGAGGLAVGVHTTQFEIRQPQHGLFKPVLELAKETADACAASLGRPVVLVGGICGKTPQALEEAAFLKETGYDAGLLSLAALKQETVPELIAHCRAVAELMPLMGFYLQPAVGGRLLPAGFWRQFAEIENVVAIKMAPFNRYQTFDVVRGVAEAGRAGDIALYTGNDDNIIVDLLTPYHVRVGAETVAARIAGGLLGHWACWTRTAVAQLNQCHAIVKAASGVPEEMLTQAAEVTDCNAAFFDAANAFAGCIAGIHEVLARQGLMAATRCLNPKEVLSPGQSREIDRVYNAYPHLNDDAFVKRHLDEWLA
ncbi:MAG TPA: dihydrodipicolinate synthase family protein [Candidatus Hydrogenedentes bacterium]|nr:dihydrodipicolinate synthase family protein [Candidatus Hydrogenedentota bacterium]